MVVKRKNWITHIILIILVVLILFPVVWVVSTSLRRDDAAFSSKLFSSRMSLQNYKDLLFPEENVLRLLSDIESITTNSQPYDKQPVESLIEKFKSDIVNLKKYSQESKDLIKETDKEYSYIENFVEENSEKLIQGIKSVVEDLTNDLVIKKPEDEILAIAINSLIYDDKKIKERNLEDIGIDVDYGNYKVKWQEELNEKKQLIEEMEEYIKSLENKIKSMKKDLDYYQEEYRRLELILNESIIPQFESFNKTLEVAYNLLSNKSNQIRAIVSEKTEYEDFIRIYNIVEELKTFKINGENKKVIDKLFENMTNVKLLWEGYTEKNSANYADFISLIKQFNLKALKQIKESYNLLSKFSSVENEYLRISNEYTLLSNKLNNEKSKIEELKDEYENIEKKYMPGKAYVMSKVVENTLNSFVEKINGYSLPKDINKLYLSIRVLNRKVNDLLYYIEDSKFKSSIRADLRKLDWVATYRNLIKRYEKFSDDAKEFVEEYDKYVAQIESTGINAIYSAKNGVKVRIAALLQLFTKVQSSYPAEIASNLGIASKAAADLMEQFPLNDLDKHFKNIDEKLFRYDQIWKQKQRHYLWRWIFNSVIVAGIVAIVTTLVNALAAYPFSRMRFKGRKYGIMSLLLIQMFPAIMYMIALYGFLSFIGRYIPWLGLNTLGGLIFVYLGNIAFNMYLIKGFYDTIPSSLEEAAMIDGATRWQTFWRIVLPLASPILAVVVILTFMGTFNEFVLAKIILQDVEKYTYAVGLWTFSSGPYETEWGLFSAAALVGMLPMVILFLSMQKYLVGGLTKGSVKG